MIHSVPAEMYHTTSLKVEKAIFSITKRNEDKHVPEMNNISDRE